VCGSVTTEASAMETLPSMSPRCTGDMAVAGKDSAG
jgi:hypothetical protein